MQSVLTRLAALERSERAQPGLDRSSALVALQFLIARHFNLEELRQLCFEMQIETSRLDGVGAAAKARELVKFCDRHGRLDDLLALVQKKRPEAPWSYAASLGNNDG